MLRFIPGFLIMIFLLNQEICAQVRSLDFYLDKGASNSPYLKDLTNQAKISGLENDKLSAGYKKPNIYATSNIMKAPIINGVGYNEAITDGAHYSALININQPLFKTKYLQTEKEKNDLEAERSLFSGKLSLRELTKQITDQYVICFYDQEHLSFQSDFFNLLTAQYNTSLKLAETGILKASDLILLEIEVGNTKNQIATILSHFREDIASLNILSGILDTTLCKFEKPFLPSQLNITSRLNFLNQFRLDSLMAESTKKVYDLKYQPQVSAFADAGLNAIMLQNLQNRLGFSAGLNFSLNIFDGKQKKINEDQTKIKLETIDKYKEHFKTEQVQNLNKLIKMLGINEDQIKQSEKQLNKYKILLEIYRKELERGDLSVTDYLTTIRSYKQTQDEYLKYNMENLIIINAYNYWNW